jgi:sulfur transfer complex TusBCD TusB component (DsrH family)
MIIYITTKTPTNSDCAFIEHAVMHAKAQVVLAGEAVYSWKKYSTSLKKPILALDDDLSLRGIQAEDGLLPLTIGELAGLSELSKNWIAIND